MKKKFKCEIDCADCAAKIEDAINKLDGVEEILETAIMTGKKIEPDFTVEIK